MKKILAAFPLILLVIGCEQGPPPTDPSVILARSAAWEAALNAKDIDAMVALYESNARLLPPNGEMVSGGAAVRNIFGGMIDAGLSGELKSVETVVFGDFAYNLGNYTLMSGDTQVDVGKYMETWHRGDDGQWRYTNDMWSSDVPVPPTNPHILILHEVDDVEHWLAAWRGEDSRHQLFKDNGADHVHTYTSAEDSHLTGLSISVADMDALNAMLESEEGQAAAAEDGVRVDTIKVLTGAK
jgi:ketosteroid isomerase-like protein